MRGARWLVIFFSLLLCVAASAAVRTATLRVESMNTRAEADKVSAALKATPGVLEVAADPSAHIVMVRFESSKTTVLDISDASAEAGFPASVLSGGTSGQTVQVTAQRSLDAMKDFDQVLVQTREARQGGRYGLVRNLMPAMKLRCDAVVAAEKASAAAQKRSATGSTSYNLAVSLSNSVASLAAVAEKKDRAKVDQQLPQVKEAFQKLAKANNFDEMVAPAEPAGAQGQQKSLTDQLMEKIKDLAK